MCGLFCIVQATLPYPHSSVMMAFFSLSSFSLHDLKKKKYKFKLTFNLFILITINEIQHQKQNVINQVFQ